MVSKSMIAFAIVFDYFQIDKELWGKFSILTNKQIIQQLLKAFEILRKENIRLALRVAELEEKLSK